MQKVLPIEQRTLQENNFRSFDGTELFYRHWLPTKKADQVARAQAVILFHRGHEHGGRMAHLVDELNLPHFHFFAWDARGLGRSGGERGYAEDFGVLVKDVDAFVRYVTSEYHIPMHNIAVIAQSVGAVLVATWVHDYAPDIRCMVLASPAFKVKLYVPFARTGLALMQKFRRKFFVNSYVKAKFLTHDEDRITSYNNDPLITRPIAANILLSLYETADRIIADAAAIHIPTQLLVSGADWVVHHRPQYQFLERLSSVVKESHTFDGFFHDTLGEKERKLPITKAREFILRMFDTLPSFQQTREKFVKADQEGYTRKEFDRLSHPTALLAGIYWYAMRASVKIAALVSTGVRLGVDKGFDSGSTLDYVYRNTAQGITPLGRVVDRVYLNSIGWRGIRVRKKHLERLIADVVLRLQRADRVIYVVDIAAGHGRYVLEALEKHKKTVQGILLRDYSDINVTAGHKLIAEKRMADIAKFSQGDAFDPESLASLNPQPTLAIVSGLYELFPSNDMIQASLAGLTDAVAPGGYLIYTNQPWHPQLELIARVLTSHRAGKPWVMRRRTQAEMDALVYTAGFDKLDQFTDEWGIFSVSLAQRRNV